MGCHMNTIEQEIIERLEGLRDNMQHHIEKLYDLRTEQKRLIEQQHCPHSVQLNESKLGNYTFYSCTKCNFEWYI
jgi:hypothetical protein